ncbi:MAG: type II secretion system F family protein [Clostridiaceae bacterium]
MIEKLVKYKYIAVNLKGEEITRTYKGDNLEELLLYERKNENYIKSYKKKYYIYFKFIKIKLKDYSVLCSEISILLAAGISLIKIFELLIKQKHLKKFKPSLIYIKNQIEQGVSIRESFNKYKQIYPKLMLSLIEIGEITGNLEIIFENLAQYYEKEHDKEKKIKSALAYPKLIFSLGTLVVFFIMLKIVPNFINTLDGLNGDIPKITMVTINISNFLKNYYGLIFILSCFIYISIKYVNEKWNNIINDKIHLKIPFVKDLYLNLIEEKFSMAMGILIGSGVNLVEGLEVASLVLNNNILNKKMETAIENIKTGNSIAESLERAGIFEDRYIEILKIGEESGRLEFIFNKLYKIYEKKSDYIVKNINTYLEPILLILLTFFVVFIILSIMLPYLNLLDSI